MPATPKRNTSKKCFTPEVCDKCRGEQPGPRRRIKHVDGCVAHITRSPRRVKSPAKRTRKNVKNEQELEPCSSPQEPCSPPQEPCYSPQETTFFVQRRYGWQDIHTLSEGSSGKDVPTQDTCVLENSVDPLAEHSVISVEADISHVDKMENVTLLSHLAERDLSFYIPPRDYKEEMSYREELFKTQDVIAEDVFYEQYLESVEEEP